MGMGTSGGRAATASAPPSAGPAAPSSAAARPRSLRPMPPFRSLTALQLVTFVLSLFGLAVSVYLTIAHFDTKVTLACADHGLVNCEEVTTSPESEVFGIFPVAVLGLAFYAFMTAINSPWAWRMQIPAVRWIRLGSLVVGMGFVLYLIYAELIKIGAICLWCTSVHVTTFLLFSLIVVNASFTWNKVDAGRPS